MKDDFPVRSALTCACLTWAFPTWTALCSCWVRTHGKTSKKWGTEMVKSLWSVRIWPCAFQASQKKKKKTRKNKSRLWRCHSHQFIFYSFQHPSNRHKSHQRIPMTANQAMLQVLNIMFPWGTLSYEKIWRLHFSSYLMCRTRKLADGAGTRRCNRAWWYVPVPLKMFTQF